MSGEELPIELDKLEIGPVLPQIKFMDQNNLPFALNPFYDEAIKENPAGIDFGAKTSPCNCRVRRHSESILDNCKTPSTLSSYNQTTSSMQARPQRTIRNSNQFKKAASNSVGCSSNNLSKVVLREPILRAFQQCLHPHSLVRKKLQVAANKGKFNYALIRNLRKNHLAPCNLKSSDETIDRSNCRTLETLNLEDSTEIFGLNNESKLTAGVSKDKNKSKATDFRQLIEECQNLLETNVSFSKNFNSNHSRRNSENFNTIQTSSSRSSRETVNIDASTLAAKFCGDPVSRSVAASSTTCSQQARINTNGVIEPIHSNMQQTTTSSGCDVTIDELASYFETFVHIPKKMSTMAEMMYI